MNAAQRAMDELLKRDPRFKIEAYAFVRDALSYAQRTLMSQGSLSVDSQFAELDDVEDQSRHLTGQQLCEACRQHALEQYGYLAPLVLANWGLKSTSNFGDVVYNLIEIKHMRKSDADRREDFNDVFSFHDAFQPHFELLSTEEA
jgi:uncharacterized repeat protein (TIGR04138 family)